MLSNHHLVRLVKGSSAKSAPIRSKCCFKFGFHNTLPNRRNIYALLLILYRLLFFNEIAHTQHLAHKIFIRMHSVSVLEHIYLGRC